jgi:hypothetical protein
MSPEDLTAWADKIDNRLGPISGRDADALAVLLRKAAEALSGIRHPTGSEAFAAHLGRLGAPAPWALSDEWPGEVLAANKAIACRALDAVDADRDQLSTETAMWIICAVNTLAGFRAEST